MVIFLAQSAAIGTGKTISWTIILKLNLGGNAYWLPLQWSDLRNQGPNYEFCRYLVLIFSWLIPACIYFYDEKQKNNCGTSRFIFQKKYLKRYMHDSFCSISSKRWRPFSYWSEVAWIDLHVEFELLDKKNSKQLSLNNICLKIKCQAAFVPRIFQLQKLFAVVFSLKRHQSFDQDRQYLKPDLYTLR